MKKIIYLIVLYGVIFCQIELLSADVCKVKCRTEEGVICLERGPCEPINDLLLKAAKECRDGGPVRYVPMTRLSFVDILSQVIRLDRELPQNLDKLSDKERYNREAELLAGRGIGIFVGKNALDPLGRDELATVLKEVTIKEDLGYSSGLTNQAFELANDGFVIYDVTLYADEGKGFETWEREQNFENSLSDSKHYVIKLDSCGSARVVLGDNEKGKIPVVGSRLKASYRIFGKEDEFVTECEVVLLLSNPALARSLRNEYNPSKPLTKANFADLLIKTMHMQRGLPRDAYKLSERELYLLESKILSKKGINIFTDTDPDELLTREELARILYDSPVEEVVGISNGKENQKFDLTNAGFIIYDLHVFVNEGAKYEEWNKRDNFMESSSRDKDYLVKLDSGNYATIYFGDMGKGKIPAVNSPIKATYRLYAPVTMLTEDDIICVLGKIVPVSEAYTPPPPPFDFPDPPDGYDDPATHI